MPARTIEFTHDRFLISTDRSRLDVREIHRFLSTESYWAENRAFEVQARAIAHSHLVAGAYDTDGRQVGFGRMVTDLAVFAYLSDVYVVPECRAGGLGRAIVESLVQHPDVVDIRWQLLATGDAHGLYEQFGYTALDDPAFWMHRRGPG
jgi:GNAT superfamily N-acetyltransferase